jgi:hypothetical protein
MTEREETPASYEDMRAGTQAHYAGVSERGHDWSNQVPQAIDHWYTCPNGYAAIDPEPNRPGKPARTPVAANPGLREALREAIDYIRTYDDAIGHSYCNLNVGGGWAPDPPECTCGLDDKIARWEEALRAAIEGDTPVAEHRHSMWECGKMKHVESSHWMDEPCSLPEGDPDRCRFEPFRNTRADLAPVAAREGLAELRALSDAASPGPWAQGTDDGSFASGRFEVWSPSGHLVADATQSIHDAAFIPAAVNYVRSLLATPVDADPERDSCDHPAESHYRACHDCAEVEGPCAAS